MPHRTARVIIHNRSNYFRLVRTVDHLCGGEWTPGGWRPPEVIEPGATGGMQSESAGVLTGTEGYVKYDVFWGVRRLGMVYIYWTNPHAGVTDSKRATHASDVPPDCDYENPDDASTFSADTALDFHLAPTAYKHSDGGGDIIRPADLAAAFAAGPVGGIAHLFGLTGIFRDPVWEFELRSGGYSTTSSALTPGDSTPPDPEWFSSNHERLGDTYLASEPAAVSWGPERLDVFHGVPGNSRLIGHTWYHGAGFNHEALDVRAPDAAHGFAATSRRLGWLDVFYNSDRQIWHLIYDGSRWHDPYSLAGTPLQPGTGLAAISWGGDRLDVFYRGQNGQLAQRYRPDDDSAWSAEVDLGGHVQGRPAVASWGPERLDVFYQGTDDQLHQTWWRGDGWRTAALGGSLSRDPAVVSWGGDRLDLFYRNQTWQLIQRVHENGRWQGETNLGHGPIENLVGLTVTSWAPRRLDLFYTNISSPPSGLWHHWYNG